MTSKQRICISECPLSQMLLSSSSTKAYPSHNIFLYCLAQSDNGSNNLQQRTLMTNLKTMKIS